MHASLTTYVKDQFVEAIHTIYGHQLTTNFCACNPLILTSTRFMMYRVILARDTLECHDPLLGGLG